MSDHLPECIYAPPNVDPVKGIEWGGSPCICNRLSACEQRVLDDDVLAAAHHSQKGYEVGFRKGLDAAREAVEIVPPSLYSYRPDESLRDVGIWKSNVLAAIDALREERK